MTVLVAVGAAVAAPAVLKLLGVNDWRWLLLGGVIGALVGIPAKVYEDKIKRYFQHRDDSTRTLARAVLAGGKCRVRDITDPTLLGVHRSLEETQPLYVRRDVHEEVVSCLRPGNFLLLVGDSTAGKTRTAYEAVRATLPRWRLVAPDSRDVLDAAVDAVVAQGKSVLWLDDLERFLGTGGLTIAAVARIKSGVIVATLRREERHQLTAGDERQLGDEVRRVLDLAHQVTLERRFSQGEVKRAEARRSDSQIRDALEHSGEYGLPEYIAAGPVLLDHWRTARAPGIKPRGAALVTAAIDCRRAGFRAPIPKALLIEVHEKYLKKRDRPESAEEAWAWATTPPRGATSALLEPTHDGCVDVFDYLVDHVQRASAPGDHVPDGVVLAALDHADAFTAHAISDYGRTSGLYRLALTASRHAMELVESEFGPEHTQMLTARADLALAMVDMGDFADADTELRAVLEASTRTLGAEHPHTLAIRNNHADMLARTGDLTSAAAEHRAVLEASTRVFGPEHPNTLVTRLNLAQTLTELGDLTAAFAEHQVLVEVSARTLGPEHPNTLIARSNLAGIPARVGDFVSAATEYQAIIDASVRTMGLDHPKTLAIRMNRANVVAQLGDLTIAASELQAVHETMTSALGLEHPDTVKCRESLAFVEKGLRRRHTKGQRRSPR